MRKVHRGQTTMVSVHGGSLCISWARIVTKISFTKRSWWGVIPYKSNYIDYCHTHAMSISTLKVDNIIWCPILLPIWQGLVLEVINGWMWKICAQWKVYYKVHTTIQTKPRTNHGWYISWLCDCMAYLHIVYVVIYSYFVIIVDNAWSSLNWVMTCSPDIKIVSTMCPIHGEILILKIL